MKRCIATLAVLSRGALAACNERGTGAAILASATASPTSVSRRSNRCQRHRHQHGHRVRQLARPYITIEGGLRPRGLGTRMTFSTT